MEQPRKPYDTVTFYLLAAAGLLLLAAFWRGRQVRV